MYIYNFKINGNKLFRTSIILIILISLVILLISVFNLYNNSKFLVSDETSVESIISIDSNQYTNTLKEVYDNIDTYIRPTSPVYRIYI